MDLSRVDDVEKLSLCKKYFVGGFFALPLLWLVNFVWFFEQAFLRPQFKQQNALRFFVIGSLVGFFVYMTPIVSWIVYYQLYRVDLGKWGQSIAFMTPAGRP